jgi:hypothetical protein
MSSVTLILIVVAVLAVAAAVWMYFEKQRTQKLRSKFGPEYDRAIQEQHGNRKRAEMALENREKRVEMLHIRPLAREDRDRFAEAWRKEQARFVDDPRGAVEKADVLVAEVMKARGYPVSDFEQRAADVSVDHPQVVENYRAAHNIAARDKNGQAGTEDLRKAMVHYRALFEHLLEQRVAEPQEVRR